MAEAPENHFQAVDSAIFAAYATAVDAHEMLSVALAEERELVSISENNVKHVTPLLGALREQASLISRLATKLGFSPTSRGSVLPVSPPAKPTASVFERFKDRSPT